MARILFPDISGHQTDVNLTALTRWQRSKYGIAFVVIKAGERDGDTDYPSSSFKPRWQQLDHLAEVRGAYYFADVGATTPKHQADVFFNTVHDAGLRRTTGKADILILDAERGHLSPQASRQWMGDFLAHLDARSHAAAELRPAWIYGGEWFRTHCSPGPIDRYFWLSAYVNDPSPDWPSQVSKPNLRIAVQFTDGAVGPEPHTIDGVGHSDLSWFQGGKDRLRSVAGVR